MQHKISRLNPLNIDWFHDSDSSICTTIREALSLTSESFWLDNSAFFSERIFIGDSTHILGSDCCHSKACFYSTCTSYKLLFRLHYQQTRPKVHLTSFSEYTRQHSELSRHHQENISLRQTIFAGQYSTTA